MNKLTAQIDHLTHRTAKAVTELIAIKEELWAIASHLRAEDIKREVQEMEARRLALEQR